jgi:hypothetical protein
MKIKLFCPQFLYFARASDGDLIKIGVTHDPQGRVRTLWAPDSGHRGACLLAAVEVPSYVTELATHRRFDHLRVVGEWFAPGSDLLGFVGRVAA